MPTVGGLRREREVFGTQEVSAGFSQRMTLLQAKPDLQILETGGGSGRTDPHRADQTCRNDGPQIRWGTQLL